MDKPAQRLLQFDRFQLDLGSGYLRTANKEIPLRPKVFEVLRHLAENAGRLVRKQELYDAVWPNVVVTDDSLVQCIRELRKKLDDDAHHLIKTVSRRGYLLNAATSTSDSTDALFFRPRTAYASNVHNSSLSSLPDRPTIAVLPFDIIGSDPRTGDLAEGLTEDLITALAKVQELLVIARHSTAIYKDKAVNLQEVAKELSVRYIFEGSARIHGDKLRCSVQLIDTVDGCHLWAERFDRSIDDIFLIQDDIVWQILLELQVRFTEGERARIASRGTCNLAAWLLRVQGAAEMLRITQVGTLRARHLFEDAHRADPNWARPLAAIAYSHYQEARFGWSEVPESSIAQGFECAERAIALNQDDPLAYQALRGLHLLTGNHDEALTFARKAVLLAPNDDHAVSMLAAQLTYMGEAEIAIETFERALRLRPNLNKMFKRIFGLALQMACRMDRAISVLEHLVHEEPNWSDGLAQLSAAYLDNQMPDAANAMVLKILTRDPDYGAACYLKVVHFKNTEHTEWLRRLLLKAGLPE